MLQRTVETMTATCRELAQRLQDLEHDRDELIRQLQLAGIAVPVQKPEVWQGSVDAEPEVAT